MVLKKVVQAVVCLSLLLAGCSVLFAASSDRIPNVAVAAGSNVIHPMDDDAAGMVVIYSNLGPKTDAYNDNLGWVVWGPGSGLGQWMAMSFTADADSTVRRTKLPLGYDGFGANSFTLLFTEDGGGIPGTPLFKTEVTDAFDWGTCCTLDVVNIRRGISIKQGQVYWVVCRTDKTNNDAENVWAYTWNSALGNLSYNLGDGWKPYPNQIMAAFAVYGTTP